MKKRRIVNLIIFLCITLVGQNSLSAQVTSKTKVRLSNNMEVYHVITPEGQGIWTLDNKEYIPCKYSSIFSTKDFIFGKVGVGLTVEVYLAENGKLVIPESYFYQYYEGDAINIPSSTVQCLYFRSTRGQGVIDGHGKLIVPDIYLSVKNLGKYFIAQTIGGFTAAYSFDGKLIIPANRYTDIKPNTSGYLLVYRGTHVGVCTPNGRELIPANEYNNIQSYLPMNGFKVSYHSENNYIGYANNDGEILLSPDCFDVCNLQTDGMIFTRIDTICNLYNKNGEFIRKEKWSPFPKRLTNINGTDKKFIIQDGTIGVLNQDNSVMIPKQYESISRKEIDKCYYAYSSRTCTLFDPDGKVIIPGIYSHIERYDTYYKIYNKDKCGLCDSNGKVLVPISDYDNIEVLSDKSGYIVTKDIYSGVISNDCKEIIPPYYTEIRKDGDYFLVAMFDKWGLLDMNGRVIIEPRYTSIHSEETLFRIQDGSYYGYADKDGKVVFSPNRYPITMLIPDSTVDGNYRIWASIDNTETDIYDIYGNIIEVLSDDNERRNYITEGNRQFDARNYSAAIEYYTRASKIKADYLVLFNIGSCYFNINQYSDAKNYLQRCLNANPPSDVKSDASTILSMCDNNINTYSAETTSFNNRGKTGAGNILKTIGRIALEALVTITATSSSFNPSIAKMYNDAYYYNPAVNISDVFHSIMNQTISTVEAQYQEEYNQYKQYHPDATFTDYQIFLGQAAAYQSGNTTYSTNFNANTSESSSSNHLINCQSCANTGICDYCGGTGYAKTGGLGLQSIDYSKTCSHCGGTGVCPICKGNHM